MRRLSPRRFAPNKDTSFFRLKNWPKERVSFRPKTPQKSKLTVIRVLVRTSARTRCWRRRAYARQAHARRQAERARKCPSVAAQNEGQCAARGGAFALVRLRIAPSFPLGGISLNPLTSFAHTTFPRCAFLLPFRFAPSGNVAYVFPTIAPPFFKSRIFWLGKCRVMVGWGAGMSLF